MPPPPDPVRYFWITGRVQGVGYRYFAQSEARRLGLSGWVRNRREGAVEVLAEGPPDQLERFEQRLRQGPSAARVDAVQRQPGPPHTLPSGEFIVKEDL